MLLSIDKAFNKDLLGAGLGDPSTWSTWLAVLRAAFGQQLSEADAATFRQVAGDRPVPVQRVRSFWALIGRGGGESRAAAALSVYLSLFQQHKLARGEVGTVLVLAATQSQAGVVFGYVRGFLQASPTLWKEVESETASEIRLRNNCVIAVHAQNFRTVRGRTLLAVVADEIAYWRDETSSVPDVECYRACLPSLLRTGGMWIAISTPYRRAGLLFQRHRDCFGRDDGDVLVVQAPAVTFNPTFPAKLIEQAIEDDPEAARSEWEATFRIDLSSFLGDAEIDAAVDHSRPLELPPRPGFAYRAFVDLSGGRH